MAAIIVFSALYAVLFMYRILREVLELKRFDATLLTVLLFSFGHVLVPTMVPDHFIISMMLLTMTLYITGKSSSHGNISPLESYSRSCCCWASNSHNPIYWKYHRKLSYTILRMSTRKRMPGKWNSTPVNARCGRNRIQEKMPATALSGN